MISLSPRWPSRFRRASAVASALVAALGALVLLGWLVDSPLLQRVHPSFVTQRPNTAVLFILLGASLGLARGDAHSRLRRGLALVVLVVAGLTLAQDLFGFDLGIDELLFRDPSTITHPGRMSPIAAGTFVLLGVALLLPLRGAAVWAGQVMAFIAAGAVLVALSGYLYGVASLYSIGPYSSMAIHSAVGALVACAAFLLARPDEGLMRVPSSDTAAGALLRRLTPATVLTPFALGWLCLEGMRHRLFDAPFGLALMALGTVAWFTLFSVGLVASLQRSELALRRLTETLEHRIAARTSELASARARAEDELQILSSLLENSSDFIGIADPTGKPIYVNRAGRQMVGLAPDYPVGKTRIPEYYPRELRAFAHDVILKTMLERGRWSGETFFRNFQTDEAIPVSDEHFIIRDPSGARLLGFGTVTRNIAAMRRADEELRESEERFRLTFDEAPIGMALVALDGRFVRVNRALCEIVGYSSDELTRLTFHDITHSDDLETDVALAGKLARGEIPRYQLAKRYFRKDGSIVDVMLHGAILRGHDGAPRYYIAQIEDITERKRAEEALRISEESLALAVDASGQGLWDWNIPANEAHLSSRYWTLIGQHEEGRRPGLAFFHSIIHPDDLPAVQRTMQEHLEGKSPGAAVIEYRVRKSSGAEVWLRGIGRVTKRDSQGAPLRMAGVIADITEQKLLEEERARAFKERETLLREIHHRVKNNLQMLSSLFYLQRQRTNQEPLRTLLDESRNRIQSIALIHEKLYQSEHLARIDFGDYLTDLTNAIGAQSPHARIVVRAGEVFLDIDRAIPCALIVNELVSNALKHAFPHGRSGEIRVTVGPDGPGRMRLAVRDDGVGFPAALDFRNTKTLGMQLVCSLTTQLRGTVELVRDGGTCFEIRFLVGAS